MPSVHVPGTSYTSSVFSLTTTAESLRTYSKLRPYLGLLMHVNGCVIQTIYDGEQTCMIPVDLRIVNTTYRSDPSKLRLSRRIVSNPKYPLMTQEVPVTSEDFLEILKLAFSGCTVEYKQQTLLDGSLEGAYFISW